MKNKCEAIAKIELVRKKIYTFGNEDGLSEEDEIKNMLESPKELGLVHLIPYLIIRMKENENDEN